MYSVWNAFGAQRERCLKHTGLYPINVSYGHSLLPGSLAAALRA